MRTRSKRGRALILGAVNVAVILGAALIIQSQASSDVAPGYSSSSFTIPDESDLAFTRDITPRAAVASTPAPAKATGSSNRSGSVAGPSISSVPTTDSATEGESRLDEIWYAEQPSAYASFPSLFDDSSAWPGLGDSPTSWGNPQPSLGGLSSRGRYPGVFGGGGGSFGGGMGGQSGSRSGSTDPVATTAGLRNSDNGSTSAVAGTPAFESMQAGASFPQGNPFSSVNAPTGFSFPLMQFPGNGPGGSGPSGLASTNVTTQSTVTTLQTPVSVPEPASALLLGAGLALAAAYRTRGRQKK